MALNTDDPFLQVQADVLSALSSSRSLFSSYQRIRSLATSPTNPELLQARAELESTIQDLIADLEDLAESVRVVEHDPYRYGLELDEVGRRRQLVEDVGREIEAMREDFQRSVNVGDDKQQYQQGRGASNGVAGALPSPSDFDNLLPGDSSRGEDYYSEMEQQTQVEMMREQDQQLDGVFRTVGNLRQQAHTMGRELEEQGEMLNDVDTLADRVGGKLQNGVRRIGHIIRKNEDTASSCCIAVLIMVLILLLVLVIIL
ncbi:hypothetical protein AJ80_08544 [Polytolypa hystricis UAMH7299]|uniref:t-SNARE affecting a late Golgi compartment protein 1 n=1 Tax=Polytolypa hystricis (strain UAMH7299) TaxID=1447883 RepID=A0A2B7X6D2_POLH7|nr:hypothetical protein AJ80_08544 [Polytolypa hystricis UAMH7299]